MNLAVTNAPVVGAVRDGLIDADIGAQTFDSNLQVNWDVLDFGVEIYRVDVYIAVFDRRGRTSRLPTNDSNAPLWTSVLTSNTSYGFSNLSLVKGETYGSCLR